MAKFLRIVEWAKFQHYKDRNPPWIKLHRELLTSNTWVELDDPSRLLAIVCMVLAADTGNMIPLDGTFIQRRAYLKRRPDVRPLVAVGFAEIVEDKALAEVASTQLADASTVRQFARPETETEKEAEKEAEAQADQEAPPEGLHQLNYAAKLLEHLGMPRKGNLETVADAIEAESKFSSLSLKGAYIYLLGKAREAGPVNVFWFRDTKWRQGGKHGTKRDEEFEAAYARARETDGENPERLSKLSARSSG